MALILSSRLVMGSVFARLGAEIEEQEGAGISMLQISDMETKLSDRVVHDEQQLAHDVSRQQQYLQSVAAGKKGSMLVVLAQHPAAMKRSIKDRSAVILSVAVLSANDPFRLRFASARLKAKPLFRPASSHLTLTARGKFPPRP